MYCKHCGKQIADDSKFCRFCGGSQEHQVNSQNHIVGKKWCYNTHNVPQKNNDLHNTGETIQENVEQPAKDIFITQVPTDNITVEDKKKPSYITCIILWSIGYIPWLILNIYWLNSGIKSSYASDYFQPFDAGLDSGISYYDQSEFLIYAICIPVLLLAIILLIHYFCNRVNKDNIEQTNIKFEETNIYKALGL